MEKDIITNALMALRNVVDNLTLNINEKNILQILMEKLMTYYKNQCIEIENHKEDKKIYISKKARLVSEMTDYIVSLNDAINGKNDIVGIVNIIYKEINYDEKKGVFKRKRLIR